MCSAMITYVPIQINKFGGNVQAAVTRALEISNTADSVSLSYFY